jgi:hypothetical protein
MMTERDFIYWLKGVFEVNGPKTLDEAQVALIKEHLDLVGKKVTGQPVPPAGNPPQWIPAYPALPWPGTTEPHWPGPGDLTVVC